MSKKVMPNGETREQYRIRYVRARLMDNLLIGTEVPVILEESRRLGVALRFQTEQYHMLFMGLGLTTLKSYLGSDSKVLMELAPRLADDITLLLQESGYLFECAPLNPEKISCYLISPNPSRKQTMTIRQLAERLALLYGDHLSAFIVPKRMRHKAYVTLSGPLCGLAAAAPARRLLSRLHRLAFFDMGQSVLDEEWLEARIRPARGEELNDALGGLWERLRNGENTTDALRALVLGPLKFSFDFELVNTFLGAFSLEYFRFMGGFCPEEDQRLELHARDFVTIEELCGRLCAAFDACLALSKSRTPVSLVTYRAIRILKQELHDNAALERTAEQLGITTRYLRRVFREDMGVGIHQYLTGIRIQTAKSLLENTGLLVRDVGAAVGFSNPEYFNRFFQKHVGVTPGKYAKSHLEPDLRNGGGH